ncbi:restriction endonuclease fold toxin-2 domain-containing protein [Streptomyces fenghuangensis]
MNLVHRTEKFVNASWSLVGLRDLIFEMLGLLSTELGKQEGMVGDDDAGRAFTAVYKPAVQAVFDKAGFAHQVMAGGAGSLLKSAEEFLKNESDTAAAFLKQDAGAPRPPGIAPQPSGPDCTPRASHNAEDLPEIVGETGWVDQYLLHQRFRGQQGKLRAVATTWRNAAKILEDAYWDSEHAWQTANLGQAGDTADAVEDFFKKFVGKTPPPGEVGEDETLMANLPTACRMIAKACDSYADHIDTALDRIPTESNPFVGEALPLWESPLFGGNGHDGGLHELVSGDVRIAGLGTIPPSLDSARERVRMPQPDGGRFGLLPSVPPFLAPLARIPTLVPVGYRPPIPGLRIQPVPPPQPPDPRFPALTEPERQKFQTWLASLRAGDISGGRPAEVAYQKRVAGYPEYEVPIPKGISANSTLMVDGFRETDGMAIDAKYVNKPGKKCYRSLEELRESHQTGQRDFLYKSDRDELAKYAAALKDPRNTQMRGLEIVTNNPDSVSYWRVMMAAHGVKGYARHVP